MGTPDFAVPALQKLLASKDHQVVSVFTAPPKPKGRGLKMQFSPVHNIAMKHHLEVYTPTSLKVEEVQKVIDEAKADIIVVVAYGLIIPKTIIESKKYGCLNIHPSKLPRYRGAAPLQRTIINGDRETAVCIMQMDEGLDTGDIILQENLELEERITLPELHDRCANIGAELLIEALDNIEKLPRIKQQEEGVIYAKKLTKEEGIIDWEESAFEIDCKVRGMNPWPGVSFEHHGRMIKVLETEIVTENIMGTPGTILNEKFAVTCGKGVLRLLKVKPEGKAAMKAEEYLRGLRT